MMLMMPNSRPLWLFMVSMVPYGWLNSMGTMPFMMFR